MRRVRQRTEGRSRRGRVLMPHGTGEQHKLFHFSAFWSVLTTNVLCCSIHNAVIAVFQKKGLADNELYALNEGVR